jgi:flagellar basal body-associated protein FliL
MADGSKNISWPKEEWEILLNSLLHVFLLSFFIISFYFLKAAPLERDGMNRLAEQVGKTAGQGLLAYVHDQTKGGKSPALMAAVCQITQSEYDVSTKLLLEAARAKKAEAEEERKNKNIRMIGIGSVVVLGIAVTVVTLFMVGIGADTAREIVTWNLITFVLFTGFELGFFILVATKYEPLSMADVRSIVMPAIYGKNATC